VPFIYKETKFRKDPLVNSEPSMLRMVIDAPINEARPLQKLIKEYITQTECL
jgi:hypothetical protein